MLRPRDIFKVYLQLQIPGTTNFEWVDYTDGVINIDIRRGQDEYVGRWQYTDIGQLTLTSRNNQLDPEINTRIRNKRNIKVHVYDSVTGIEQPLFEGKINNVDVQYFPRNQKPIITLTAFDLVAELVNTTMSQAQADAMEALVPGGTIVYPKTVIDYIESNPSIIPNWRKGPTVQADPSSIPTVDNCDYLVGRSYYDVLCIKSNGQLGMWWVDRNNAVNYRNRNKPSTTAQFATFSDDPVGTEIPYKTFELVDGYERIYNSYTYPDTYSNGRPATTDLYEISGSIDYWGKRPITIEYHPTADNQPLVWTEGGALGSIGGFAKESPFPHREIDTLTWDGMKNVNRGALTDINNNIRILYTIGDIELDRRYGIVGVQHLITPEEWQITYVLRNWFYVLDSGEEPAITSDRTSTDNLTAINFSILNSDLFDSVLWDFGDSTSSTSFSPAKTYPTPAVGGSTYNVTCTGTNYLGAQKTSNTISVFVTGAAPVIDDTPGIVVSDYSVGAPGQYSLGMPVGGVTGFDTLSYSISGAKNNPQKTTRSDLTVGPFVLEGTGTASRDITLDATNAYGTSSYTWTKPNLNQTNILTTPITARYITVQYSRRISQTYVYTGASTWNSVSPNVVIKNVSVKSSTGTDYASGKSMISFINGAGNVRDQSGNAWTTIVDPDILTDGSDSNWLNFTTNLTNYSAIYPLGAGYKCSPNWEFTIDLGATYTDIKYIDIDFGPELVSGPLTSLKYAFPYKTLSTTAEARTGVTILYSTTLGSPRSYYFDYQARPFNVSGQDAMNATTTKRVQSA